MASKTLIGGTAYSITKGKTLINGTGYTIQKGRTLIGGTGYTISLWPFTYEHRTQQGNYAPTGGFVFTFTEDGTQFKAQIDGKATNAPSSYSDRGIVGYRFNVPAGSSVTITVSSNSGGVYSDLEIFNGPNTKVYNTTASITGQNVTMTVTSDGYIMARIAHGSTSITTRWIAITKIVIDGVQAFP